MITSIPKIWLYNTGEILGWYITTIAGDKIWIEFYL
jgi:hypothetical protein